MPKIVTLRAYRAVLVPKGTHFEDVETLAAQGKLPVAKVEATSAYAAKKAARTQSGHQHVYDIEVAA